MADSMAYYGIIINPCLDHLWAPDVACREREWDVWDVPPGRKPACVFCLRRIYTLCVRIPLPPDYSGTAEPCSEITASLSPQLIRQLCTFRRPIRAHRSVNKIVTRITNKKPAFSFLTQIGLRAVALLIPLELLCSFPIMLNMFRVRELYWTTRYESMQTRDMRLRMLYSDRNPVFSLRNSSGVFHWTALKLQLSSFHAHVHLKAFS